MIIIFPKMAWAPPPKWHSQISFLSPNTLVNLCTKQSPPSAYSRLLWVHAPSSLFQGGDLAPSSPCLVGSSSPEGSVSHYLLPAPLPANVKGLGVEKQNPSRRARHLLSSRRFKPQHFRVVPNGTYLLKGRSFPANASNVVATGSGKQTYSEGQCR